MHRSLIIALVAVAVASWSPLASAQETSPAVLLGETLSISGSGEYEIAPEVLTFTGTVQAEGATEAEARDAHASEIAAVQTVISQLTGRGFKLAKSSYSLTSATPFRDSNAENLTVEERLKVVYTASTVLSFKTENLAEVPQFIAALAATPLEMRQFDFSVRNERAALLEARKAAARDALSQAKAYADALGLTLSSIRTVTDGDARPPSEEMADLYIPLDRKLSIVVPDTITYSGSVDVVWEIQTRSQ